MEHYEIIEILQTLQSIISHEPKDEPITFGRLQELLTIEIESINRSMKAGGGF